MNNISKNFQKSIKKGLFLYCILFLSVMQLKSQPLSGTFTIDDAGGDYSSFNEAVDSLISKGIDGDVTFNVADGTYTEQLSIPAITGADFFGGSITFESASQDSTKVTLEYSATSSSANYTLKLDGASYIEFYQMTIKANGSNYARAVELTGSMDWASIRSCRIVGVETTESSSDRALVYHTASNGDNIAIWKCSLINGSHGVYSNGSSTETNMININSCIFSGQYWENIHLSENIYSNIYNNDLSINGSTYSHNITCVNSKAIKVHQNKMLSSGGGITLQGCSADNTLTNKIYNNFVTSENSPPLSINSSSGIEAYYNNLLKTSNGYEQATINATDASLTLKNNIAVNLSGGYIFSAEGSITYTADYNNYYTNGAYIAYYNFAPITSLSSFQAETGQDANTINVDPYYVSDNDLHVSNPLLNGAGTSISDILTDIDKEDRDGTSPDIGADEFDVTADDAGATKVIHNISTGCSEVKVTVVNFGSSPISNIPVYMAVSTPDGDENLSGTVPGPLDQLEEYTLSIGNLTSTATGDYSFTAYTGLSGDAKKTNDTTRLNLTKTNAKSIPAEERFTTFSAINNWETGEGFSYDAGQMYLNLNMIKALESTSCIYKNAIGPVTSTTRFLIKFKALDVAALDPSVNVDINLYECENKLTTLYTINSTNYTPDENWLELNFEIGQYEGKYVRPQVEVTKNTDNWLHAAFDDIIIANAPVVDLGDDRQACMGSTVTLDAGASPTNTYSWHKLSDPGTELGTDQTLDVTNDGNYVVLVTEPFFNLSNSDTVSVTFGDTPTANDQTPELCSHEATSVNLTLLDSEVNGGTGTAVSWYNDAGLTSPVTTPTSVTVTDGQVFHAEVGSGTCSDTATVTYTVHSSPSSSIIPDPADLCAGDIITINGNPSGGSGSWNNHEWTGDTGPLSAIDIQEPTFSTSAAGVYSLTYTVTDDNGCQAADDITVTVNENPTADAGGDQTISVGTSTTLSVTATGGDGNYAYAWMPEDSLTNNTIEDPTTVNLHVTNIFTVTVTDGNGCSDTSKTTVFITGVPLSVIASAEPDTICYGDNSDLLAVPSGGSGSYSYAWSSIPAGFSSTVHNPVVSPDSDTRYIVEVDDGANTDTDTIEIVVNPLPSVTLTALPDVCENTPAFDLEQGTPAGGTYSGTGITTSPEFDPSVANQGVHSITYAYTDANGCSANTSQNITVLDSLTANNIYPSLCEDSPGSGSVAGIDLTSFENQINNDAGLNFTWYTNAGMTTPVANPASTTVNNDNTFYVEVDNGTCTNSATVTFSVGNTIDVNDQFPLVCETSQGLGTATGDLTILEDDIKEGAPGTVTWYADAGLSSEIANPSSVTIITSDTMYAEVVSGSCSNTAKVSYTVNPLPVIDLGNDTSILVSDSIILNAGSGFNNYKWNTSDTTQSITVNGSETGTGAFIFYVSVTSTSGCETSDSIKINVGDVRINKTGEPVTFSFYPNPADDIVTIKLNSTANQTFNLQIIDRLGRVMYENIMTMKEANINCSGLAEGVYIIKIYNDKNVMTGKLIIK